MIAFLAIKYLGFIFYGNLGILNQNLSYVVKDNLENL
jgi:hypothetical protein